MVRFAVAAVAALALVAPSQAAPLKVGDPAPKFAGLESATSGKKFSFDDYKDKDVLVICTTCNHCPFAKAYESRLVKFAKDYAGADGKVALIAVNVNTEGDDSFDKMKERAKEKSFNFEYLFDPSQKIAVDLGATATPEFFVFDKNRKLVYTGAMDDNKDYAKATKHYVEDAVKAALKGEKPETTKTAPVGCRIQFNKK
ncbi:MAG: thioredoxin family protein [Gemmataceae bacterium]